MKKFIFVILILSLQSYAEIIDGRIVAIAEGDRKLYSEAEEAAKVGLWTKAEPLSAWEFRRK